MKLSEAIEINENMGNVLVALGGKDGLVLEALHLGIEALKAIQADRNGDASLLHRNLPGETD